VRLLRSSWLIQLADNGGVLSRRQELLEDAFVGVAELRAIHEACTAKVGKNQLDNRLPIVCVSHFWRTREHPDPEGVTLRIVAAKLKWLMSAAHCIVVDSTAGFGPARTCAECGITEFGVFFDYASLFQEPRAPDEAASFKRSLKYINVWYAHALTTCLMVIGEAAGCVPYFERGWTCFEFQLAVLLCPADAYNVWPQLLICGPQLDRPVPATPEAFFEGNTYGSKHFTNGADRKLVAQKWRETCVDVLGSAESLDFSCNGWNDAAMARLGLVLPLCRANPRLNYFSLSGNTMRQPPEQIGELVTLIELDFWQSRELITLPDSISQCASLEVLNLRQCIRLRSLPESIGKLQKLKQLSINSHELTALPESIAQLESLEALSVPFCPVLKALPNRLPEGLKELKLQNDLSLTALPPMPMGLKKLYVKDVPLAGLPEGLEQRPSLTIFDWVGPRSTSEAQDLKDQWLAACKAGSDWLRY